MKGESNMNNVNYLTVKEMADRFAVSKSTIYRRIKNGSLKAIKIKGRWHFIKKEPPVPAPPFFRATNPINGKRTNCTHKYNGKITLKPIGDRKYRCSICGEEFNLLNKKEILNNLDETCKDVINVLENIKLLSLYYDATAKGAGTAIPLLNNIPKLIECLIQNINEKEKKIMEKELIKYVGSLMTFIMSGRKVKSESLADIESKMIKKALLDDARELSSKVFDIDDFNIKLAAGNILYDLKEKIENDETSFDGIYNLVYHTTGLGHIDDELFSIFKRAEEEVRRDNIKKAEEEAKHYRLQGPEIKGITLGL